MTNPRHLTAEWELIIRRIRQASRLALLTDFDGTLVRIQRAPEAVRLPSQVRNLLYAISESGVTVGVISGRSLSDLRARVGLQGIWYAGTYGLSLCRPGGHPLFLATSEQRRAMVRVKRDLARRLGALEGVRLESKDASIALHYRNVSRSNQALALGVVEEVLQKSPGIQLISGKKIWELLPDSNTCKWRAAQFILRHGSGDRRLVFYLGDDMTDESIFQKLRGISIAVGKRRRTAAQFYLRSPAEVRLFLRRLLEVRK